MEALLHAVHLYGAAGITAFGWAVCRLLDWPSPPWLPLWFSAALLIYNADRLRFDRADLLNVPQRAATVARWQALCQAVCTTAALYLFTAPLLARDWLTFGLVLGGGVICLNYSFPLLGFRWKDVPLLKTLFAPSIVTAAILGLPWLRLNPATEFSMLVYGALLAWAFLLFNMILCDLRDIDGDRAHGVRSLPVLLGEMRTRHLLVALLLIVEALILGALVYAPAAQATTWRILALLTPLHLGALIFAVRHPRSERFYEWAVEGMLFLPAVAVGLARIAA